MRETRLQAVAVSGPVSAEVSFAIVLQVFRRRFAGKKVRLLDIGCGIQRNAERDRTSATTSCPRSFQWVPSRWKRNSFPAYDIIS